MSYISLLLVTGAALADDAPVGRWFVNQTGVICVKFDGAVSFDFHYTNTSDKDVSKTVNLLGDQYNITTTSATGFCGDSNSTDAQFIEIGFFKDWKLRMDFAKVSTNSSWYMEAISLEFSLQTKQFPLPDIKENITDEVSLEDIHVFDASVGRSYQCESKQQFVNLTGNLASVLRQVNIQSMQLEAFKTTSDNTFSAPVACKDDAVSNIVPIAVGAALGALVLIVLIAYLIGRRKSRQGYESV